MAAGDITILASNGVQNLPTRPYQTEAAATDILFGEPVKLKAAGSPFVIPLADNEPVVGTTTVMLGIASGDSDHTAAADGTIDVFVPQPGVTYLCDATTVANIDTQAKYDLLVGDRVLFDFGSSTYTVDENAGDGATNGLYIENLNINDHPDKVAFSLRIDGTYLGQ